MGFRQEEKCGESCPFRHVMWSFFSPECHNLSIKLKIACCNCMCVCFRTLAVNQNHSLDSLYCTVTGEWRWIVYLSDYLFYFIYLSGYLFSLLAVVLTGFEQIVVCFRMSCISVMLFISMSIIIVFFFSHVIWSSVCIRSSCIVNTTLLWQRPDSRLKFNIPIVTGHTMAEMCDVSCVNERCLLDIDLRSIIAGPVLEVFRHARSYVSWLFTSSHESVLWGTTDYIYICSFLLIFNIGLLQWSKSLFLEVSSF